MCAQSSIKGWEGIRKEIYDTVLIGLDCDQLPFALILVCSSTCIVGFVNNEQELVWFTLNSELYIVYF
jgi:hypothetical protein